MRTLAATSLPIPLSLLLYFFVEKERIEVLLTLHSRRAHYYILMYYCLPCIMVDCIPTKHLLSFNCDDRQEMGGGEA